MGLLTGCRNAGYKAFTMDMRRCERPHEGFTETLLKDLALLLIGPSRKTLSIVVTKFYQHRSIGNNVIQSRYR